MFDRLRALDATQEADMAAFSAGSRFSLLRVAVGSVIVIALFFVPFLLATEMGLGLVGFLAGPLGLLSGTVLLARTPSGRGALWTFGKGRSPSQSILGLAVLCIVLSAALAARAWYIR